MTSTSRPSCVVMSRESAAVVAQVIPVIALALALVLRSLGSDLGHQQFDLSNRELFWDFWPAIVQAVTLVILAIAECQTLTQAISDGPQPVWFWLLKVAIVITFMSPVLEAAGSITHGFPDSPRGRFASRTLMQGISLVSAIVILGVIIPTGR